MHLEILNFVLLLGILGVPQQQPGEMQIVLPEDASTAKDERRNHFKLYARQLDLYDKYTKDKPAIRPLARKFLQHAIANESGIYFIEEPLVIEYKHLTKMGRAAFDAGSRDPLFRAYYAHTLMHKRLYSTAESDALSAVNRILREGYHPVAEAIARYTLQLVVYRMGRVSSVNKHQPGLLRLVPKYFEWATEEPDMQRPAWSDFIRFTKHARFQHKVSKKMVKAYEEMPGKDPWLMAMLKGWYHLQLERNGIKDVEEPQGAQDDESQLKLAREYLRKAWALHPDYPEAPEMMMHVASLGGDEDSFEIWFQRAVEGQIDYWPAYESMLKYLRPENGGSYEKMVAFGEACARTDRFDTLVPFYFTIATEQIQRGDANFEFLSENVPDFYDKWRYSLLKLAEHPSRTIVSDRQTGRLSRPQRTFYTNILAMALMTRNYDDAEHFWKLIGDEFYEKSFADYDLRKKYHWSEIQASKSLGEPLHEALDLLELPTSINKTKQVHDVFTKLKNQNTNEEADYFLQSIIDIAQKELDYESGKWVDLEFSPDLAEWRGPANLFKVENKSSVTASNIKKFKYMYLYHKGSFRGPKEITLELEPKKVISHWLYAGIHIGLRADRGQGSSGIAFCAEITGDGVFVGSGNFLPEKIPLKRKVTADGNSFDFSNRLHLKAWDNETFELFVNDTKIDLGSTGYGSATPFDMVGFGSGGWRRYMGEIHYKNFRIRRLTEPRPVNKQQP